MTSEWDAPLTREHTFSTGRKAVLRQSISLSNMLRLGVWDADLAAAFDLAVAGELNDPELAQRMNDAIVMGMFVTPVITADNIGVLEEAEIDETIDAAFGGAASSASFPGDEPSGGDRGDSDDVPSAPVEPRRAAGRKSGSGRVRSARGEESAG